MATAKLIHDLPERPKRTIRIVLFGSEETGLNGGKAYVRGHQAELKDVIIAAEPDLGQGPVFRFRTGVANPDETSLKSIRAALVPLGIISGDNTSHGDSETELFADAGVPTVALDLDATDYFDLHHTSDDTLDKIKLERINQTTAAYSVFTYLAAEMDGDYRAAAAKISK